MKNFDVFISHASEDKAGVARPLAEHLMRAGLKVWLDAFELHVGDSLREQIDHGLSESHFGVVILSPKFFEKEWPKRELNGLFAIEDDGDKVILPVWHQVEKGDVRRYSPILADRLAANTSQGLNAVARAIANVVQKNGITTTLADLIESGPCPDDIAAFLAIRPAILADAIGQYGLLREVPDTIQNPDLPPFHLVSSVMRGTDGSFDWRCIAFLPAHPNSDWDSRLDEFLTQCEETIEHIYKNKQHVMPRLVPNRHNDFDRYNDFGCHRFRVAVFFGRRDLMSETAKAVVRRHSETHWLQLLSYDRLLESSAQSE